MDHSGIYFSKFVASAIGGPWYTVSMFENDSFMKTFTLIHMTRMLPGYPQVTVSRLRYQLAMERFAKYFFLATLTVALVLPALYYRLSCRVNDAYWFVFLFYCVGAQVYTVFAILDLEFFEQLPDSVFESGRIDREKINRIKKQKEQNRRSAALEERQRNCAACRGTCKYCYRQLDPFPQ